MPFYPKASLSHNTIVLSVVQLRRRRTIPPQPAVQNEVLRVGTEGEEERRGHTARDGVPPVRVVRRILALEELAADDARQVGAHDDDGHRDGSLFGGLCVEGDPGGVNGVCIGGEWKVSWGI